MAVSTVSRLFLRNFRKLHLFDTALGGRHTQIKERSQYEIKTISVYRKKGHTLIKVDHVSEKLVILKIY